MLLVLAQERDDRLEIRLAERARRSCEGVQCVAETVEGVQLDVGLRLGLLAEPVDPDRRQAELDRRRDVVEEARADVDLAGTIGARAARNTSQCRWPGLYEPISDATITWSNGTPISASDASM